jgi:hypothetical protein
LRHFDYSTLCMGRIAVIPSLSILTALQHDFEETAKEMLYGQVPRFSEIMESAGDVQDRFNRN